MLYDIEGMSRKTIKDAFPMFYTVIKHGFLTYLFKNKSLDKGQKLIKVNQKVPLSKKVLIKVGEGVDCASIAGVSLIVHMIYFLA